jgi:hypothetical protein
MKEKYYIKEVDKKNAMDMIIKNHYLHRKAPCKYAFGLYEKQTNNLVGVIIYGTPASRSVQKGICGIDEANNVIELTRLWIDDKVGHNAESYLIGNTIKLVKEPIIVSYAEHKQGHLGIVYQATNWIYTGMSDRHIQWKVEGVDNKHSRHLFDKYGGINEAKKILGDKMIKEERPRKYRYIYFNCDRRRKKQLLSKLRYEQQPYPKFNASNAKL